MDDLNKDMVADLGEFSQEERERVWEEKIRTQINSLLDFFLPPSKDCNFNVSYQHAVSQILESGPVLDTDKVTAAKLTLVFEFTEPLGIDRK